MKRKLKIETKQNLQGLGFISIWLIGLLIFWIYPLVEGLIMSFNKITINGIHLIWKPIGFGNYAQILLKDTGFWSQWTPFFLQSIIMIPTITLFAIIMALFLNQKFPGRGFFRAIFFLPVLFTTGSVIINLLITNAGGGTGGSAGGTATTTTLQFLQNQNIVFFVQTYFSRDVASTIINILNSFVIILWYSGVQIVLLLAGLQSIGASIYEAADIDGANGWEKLWKITLPGIVPFILIASVYTVVDQFTMPSNPMMGMIKYNMIEGTRGLGYATAMGWLYVLFVLIIVGAIFLIFKNVFTLRERKGG
jgi:ABC-type sugar transport system permease subunit